MPLLQTSGNVTADGYGGGVAAVPNYIEDVFSTYLYTGNGSTQTITNGIDLSTYGGMVWLKARDNAFNNELSDTARGSGKYLISNSTASQYTSSTHLNAFTSSGFTVGSDAGINASTGLMASWTFREQPKFFDVVTFTTASDGSATVSHNLGSTPGCVITKCTGTTSAWSTWHRSLSGTNYEVRLNSTAAETNIGTWINPSSTQVQFIAGNLNGSQTYVAYLFAHDAGGFGLTGTDNVISCGSFTPDSSGNVDVNLGYEPQWILFKRSAAVGSWSIADTMRGMSYSDFNRLYANLSDAEDAQPAAYCVPTATGFKSVTTGVFSANAPHIYIAIRRGPMKVPTSGTSVFSPNAINNATGTANTTGFPIDLQILDYRSGTAIATFSDRLRGVATTTTATSAPYLFSSSTAAEASSTSFTNNWGNTGFATPSDLNNFSGILWNFRRAPSFFDEVCYTGTGSGTTFAHNLGVVPEMMIVKCRSQTGTGWPVYQTLFTGGGYAFLDTTSAAVLSGNTTIWNGTAPTASVFSVGTNSRTNTSGATYVAYLFATCAGVSKVGSYTGTGTTLQVNCGFTGGARFVLIKRTDSTGDWYVWDSARGIVSGNDPYLLLNSTAAEVTNTDYVDTYSAGFEISSTAPAAINASGGSFIFLAIA